MFVRHSVSSYHRSPFSNFKLHRPLNFMALASALEAASLIFRVLCPVLMMFPGVSQIVAFPGPAAAGFFWQSWLQAGCDLWCSLVFRRRKIVSAEEVLKALPRGLMMFPGVSQDLEASWCRRVFAGSYFHTAASSLHSFQKSRRLLMDVAKFIRFSDDDLQVCRPHDVPWCLAGRCPVPVQKHNISDRNIHGFHADSLQNPLTPTFSLSKFRTQLSFPNKKFKLNPGFLSLENRAQVFSCLETRWREKKFDVD